MFQNYVYILSFAHIDCFAESHQVDSNFGLKMKVMPEETAVPQEKKDEERR